MSEDSGPPERVRIIGLTLAVILSAVEIAIRGLEVFNPGAITGNRDAWPQDLAMLIIGIAIGAAGFKRKADS